MKKKIRVMQPYIDDKDFKVAGELVEKKWITSGVQVRSFENEFAKFLGRKYGVAVNSGSSANLVMVEVLKALKYLKKGDKVITPALTWGTTVSPLIQTGMVPIFLDITLEKKHFLTLDREKMELALEHFKGAKVFPLYTLGFEPKKEVLEESMMADCCDALNRVPRNVLISSYSFFMAHHLVAGEGGMILTDDPKISRIGRAVRDTGRKCYLDCPFWSKLDVCKQITDPEFICPHSDWRMSFEIPAYNLKMLDLCASIGRAQLRKVGRIMGLRKRNAKFLCNELGKLRTYGLRIPEYTESASWFSFPIIFEGDRGSLVKYLNRNRVETRPILSGNITRHNFLKGKDYQVPVSLENTELVHKKGFMIGCHPSLTIKDLKYIVEKFEEYFEED